MGRDLIHSSPCFRKNGQGSATPGRASAVGHGRFVFRSRSPGSTRECVYADRNLSPEILCSDDAKDLFGKSEFSQSLCTAVQIPLSRTLPFSARSASWVHICCRSRIYWRRSRSASVDLCPQSHWPVSHMNGPATSHAPLGLWLQLCSYL